MGLDISLYIDAELQREGSGIFKMDCGEPVEITRSDWDYLFPWFEPTILESVTYKKQVEHVSITHNLVPMAKEVGLYEIIWRPEEHGITHAKQLIEPLTTGFDRAIQRASELRPLAPARSWGTYEDFMNFLGGYLKACRKSPEATIQAYR